MAAPVRLVCHTYPSYRERLEGLAKESGMTLGAYFRNVIKAHILSKGGRVDEEAVVGGHVYLIECAGRYKIGISGRDPIARIQGMCLPMKPTIHAVEFHENYKSIEKELHERFSARRVYGEWFELSADEVAQAKQLLGAKDF